MANVVLSNIIKKYPNGFKAVKSFSLDIRNGEFIVLVGSSGCGKSTLLRMIAGLEQITEGKLYCDDKDITNVAPKDRDIAMVFQNYALYPQMTVYQNLAFSLAVKKEDGDVIHKKVMGAASLLGLVNQLNKKPNQLSGGQRQRVAVGRSIVRNPKVFLFDEPLSNLDAKMRNAMRHELKILHRHLKTTMIYVTHDQIEALTLADRIVVMSEGQIQQIGTPLEVYNNPSNLFVASFIGLPPMNLLEVSLKDNKLLHETFSIELNNEQQIKLQEYNNKQLIVGIRPERVDISDMDTDCGVISVTVDIKENLGQSTLIHCKLDNGQKAVFKVKGWQELNTGDKLQIKPIVDKLYFFDKDTKNAITSL